MESNLLTAVALPAALAIIMLGLGLSLTTADFKRVIVYPKAVAVGLGSSAEPRGSSSRSATVDSVCEA